MSFLSFTHTALLWALPLAAIPLVLHLLTLHRLKTVELSTFRFLFDSYVQQRRRMQFLEALLAILRTLFLLLLVFLLSRPAIKNWDKLFGGSGGGSGQEVIMLVDCSASMNASQGGLTSMKRARDAALQVARKLGRDDRLTLIRLTSNPEEVFSRFGTDAKEIEDKIEALKASSSRANLFAALMQLFGPEASRRSNPVIYLFTDCQATGWREVRNQGLDKLLPPKTPFYVVNVGPTTATSNRAVIGDAPRKNRVVAGLPLALQARVTNFSKTEPAEVTLSVYIKDKEVKREPLTLKPGETVTKKIDYTPREPGIVQGRFEITSTTPDRFPDDDRFFFTLHIEPRIKVLLVNGNPSMDELVDEARFLKVALTSRGESIPDEKGGIAAGSKEILSAIDVREIAEPLLTPDTLKESSVVVLANCGNLNAGQFEWLRTFVRDGGGLLILPGDRVQPPVYNTQFFPVPGPQGQTLTAATLDAAVGDPDKLETFEPLAALDFAHPALSVFDEPDPDRRYFKSTLVYKRFKIILPEKKGNAWTFARFASGAPALVESRLGDGAVVLAAFPGHSRWTNLPVKKIFVPLMLRLVSHLQHHPEVDVSPMVPADGAAEVAAALSWGPVEARVSTPGGGAITKQLERSGNRLVASFDNTSQRGYYTAELRSLRTDQVRAATLGFAVNLPPEESDFSIIGEEELKQMLPWADLTFVDASADAQFEKGGLGQEVEIWKYLIWIVFIVIAVEFLLATTAGKRLGDEPPSVGERIRRLSPGAWVGSMTGAGQKTDS